MKRPRTDRCDRRPPVGAVLVGLALTLGSGRLEATPAELFGAGPRSTSLAGAGVSLELGAESTLTNPAELAWVSSKELELGLRSSRFVLELEQSKNEQAIPAELSSGFFFGTVAPLSDGAWRSALGVFAGSPPDFIVRARLPFAEQPDFPLLVGRARAFDFAAAVAVGHGPWSFGLGLRALAALSGKVGVEERNGRQSEVVEDELVPAYAPLIGLGLDAGAGFALGVAARGAMRADFDVTLTTTDVGGIPLPPMHVEGVAHYEPLRVDAEVSRRMGPWTALFALSYERWSDFPGSLGQTVHCPKGSARCGVQARPSPNASDILIPRLAGVRELSLGPVAAEIRVGYAFTPPALPEQRGRANAFDAARHSLAFGYSVALLPARVPLHFDFALRLDVLAPRTHDKSDAPAIETHGVVETFSCGARVEL